MTKLRSPKCRDRPDEVVGLEPDDEVLGNIRSDAARLDSTG
jgi:hypothetical protein